MGEICSVANGWVSNYFHIHSNLSIFVVGADMQDGDEEALPSTKRKKKLLVDFDRDDNGGPILNDPSQMIARVMEPMVRQFMSIHYSESTKS
jgi:hypothetical protein